MTLKGIILMCQECNRCVFSVSGWQGDGIENGMGWPEDGPGMDCSW